MSYAVVKRWYDRLPEAERNLPIVHVGHVVYTPSQILFEVSRGSPLGEQLQKMVEAGDFGTPLEKIAEMRLEQLLKQGIPYDIVTLSGRVLTPQELLEEIKKRTPLGKQLIQAEIKQMKRVLALARR